MSEEVTQEPEAVPDVPKDDAPAPDDQTLGEPGLKALQAERQARREAERLLAEQQAKVTEFEAAGKTELERVTDRAAKAEQALKDATMQLARERVARRVGLPEKFIDRLRGDTEEELEDDATSLLEDLPAREGPTTPPVRDGETPNPAANVAPGAPRLEAAYAQAAKTART